MQIKLKKDAAKAYNKAIKILTDAGFSANAKPQFLIHHDQQYFIGNQIPEIIQTVTLDCKVYVPDVLIDIKNG